MVEEWDASCFAENLKDPNGNKSEQVWSSEREDMGVSQGR